MTMDCAILGKPQPIPLCMDIEKMNFQGKCQIPKNFGEGENLGTTSLVRHTSLVQNKSDKIQK
jgi:hypothetical protein